MTIILGPAQWWVEHDISGLMIILLSYCMWPTSIYYFNCQMALMLIKLKVHIIHSCGVHMQICICDERCCYLWYVSACISCILRLIIILIKLWTHEHLPLQYFLVYLFLTTNNHQQTKLGFCNEQNIFGNISTHHSSSTLNNNFETLWTLHYGQWLVAKCIVRRQESDINIKWLGNSSVGPVLINKDYN